MKTISRPATWESGKSRMEFLDINGRAVHLPKASTATALRECGNSVCQTVPKLRFAGVAMTVAILVSQICTVALGAIPSPGTNTWTYYQYAETSATNLQSSTITTEESGSSFVVWVGRGETNGFTYTPWDNKGNTYQRQGAFQVYIPDWPASGCAVYVATNAIGGTGHRWNVGSIPQDETTMIVLEVKNGVLLKDVKFNRVAAPPQTSATVTTDGPALLVAVWAGDQIYPQSLSVGNGFTIQVKKAEPPPTSNYVQGGIATKQVTEAGSYNVTWTSEPNEGANMWLLVFESAELASVSLQAQVTGGNLVLSWPTSEPGYSLETTSELVTGNPWTQVTNAPVIVDSYNYVTNPISPGAHYYRLRK